ncbi:glycosyltransferase family 1 protein [Gloeocapsa sp. PCC 73106]|uniref:glycosyltransferase family 4 protein n=1 Tax=Gloeocapsa sp. PCC 73106 TaxID=102232 RepID=UPI0002ACA59C|nr:glycosyltransferase family 1 protein [Gloeocapsa sp. PCC 73106]ELR98386.1 glycosyltransferase [Gloeocapsa sp. PCC 73106]
MKILYDHQMFTIQKFGGISRIFIELMRELSQYSECVIDWYRGWHKDGYDVSDFRPRLRRYWSFPGGDQSQLNRLGWKVFNLTAPQVYDLYHPTYYDISLLPLVKHQKLVITVHDLILEKFLCDLERFQPQIQAKKKLVEQADLIFVNSLNTQRDLTEMLKVDAAKIVLTPWGTHIDAIIPTPLPELNEEKPYFLYVGTRSKYKNFSLLVQAFAQSSWLAANFRVICFGGTSDFTPPEREIMVEHNVLDNFSYLAGDDAVLKTLYQQAQALVYTSRYEGFGLPLLEAMTCNCPVICCPTSSLPEVVGEAAIFFNSDSVEALVSALTTAVTDTAKRQDILAKGQDRAKLFSWQKTAKLTLQGYQQVLKGVN